jgi:hypothetical protein
VVKVGFICEGATETRIIASNNFKIYLQSIFIERVNVIDAGGCGNLLPHNIEGYITSLENAGAKKIIILTDLDKDACITITKNRIGARANDVVIIAVKQIEAWLLANIQAMRLLLNDDSFVFEYPENEVSPFETIRQLLVAKTSRGINNKVMLVNRLIERYNLQIELSAHHPNCKSVEYFITKLNAIAV